MFLPSSIENNHRQPLQVILLLAGLAVVPSCLMYEAFSLFCHFPGLSALFHNHDAPVGSRGADALSVDGIASVAGIAVEEGAVA